MSDSHPGQKHVEVPFDSFTIHGSRGDHVCTALEPSGRSIREFADEAVSEWALMSHEKLSSKGNPWSVVFAKRACWQILTALNCLHESRIAHRDILPFHVRFALDYDLSALSENEIQKSVWPEEKREEVNDSPDYALAQWFSGWEECRRRSVEQWKTYERGDIAAEPHSDEWNKANFFNSRDDIDLMQRKDGKPLEPDEIHYTVRPAPLETGFDPKKPEQDQNFRLVLSGLGIACPFEDCDKSPLPLRSDYSAPEWIIGRTCNDKSDIFSLGLVFWEIVMLRSLVEECIQFDDPGHARSNNQEPNELARRVSQFPDALRPYWCEGDDLLNYERNALDFPQMEEEPHRVDGARVRKPLDMSDEDMKMFMRLLKKMLQYNPELRPSTAELLQDEWFRGM
ncbi:kinase-like protein [Hypoxylon rubiginosum]|uniref:Kinase-like protein n=1 Tax=Hypoxylon rubiginosum TaxID=110542 RepID=A0ACC0CMT4_9PEZI|nr:kinase-like protein [Hypoxylon rubiginosum]